MKKYIYRLGAAVLCLAVLMAVGAVPAMANSAQDWWRGVDSTGAVVTDENSPIVVESELLTFDIHGFPEGYYRTEEEYLSYQAAVTAEYSFYNPSDYTVAARLLFPFGSRPDYAQADYQDSEGRRVRVYADDTAKFDVAVNGAAIEKTLRHTLIGDRYADFVLADERAKLYEGYAPDEFYAPDMPVTRFNYTVSGVDEEADPAANAAFDLAPFDGRTKYILMEQSGMHTQQDGENRISAWVENGDTLTLYVIGQLPAEDIKWAVYHNGGVADGTEVGGAVTLVSIEELCFEDLVMSEYDEARGVSPTDWYNAVVADLNGKEYVSGAIGEARFNISASLMRWYEYELTFAPGERLVNTVTAPMYPTIDAGWEPAIYEYVYLLSPAKTWAGFGKLDIVINTPYYLTERAFDGWVKTESGYQISLDSLPEGELEFTLSTEEEPVGPQKTITDYIPIEVLLILLLVLLIPASLILLHLLERRTDR